MSLYPSHASLPLSELLGTARLDAQRMEGELQSAHRRAGQLDAAMRQVEERLEQERRGRQQAEERETRLRQLLREAHDRLPADVVGAKAVLASALEGRGR